MKNTSKTPNMSNRKRLASSHGYSDSQPLLGKFKERNGINVGSTMLNTHTSAYGKGKHAAQVGMALRTATSSNGLFDISC